MSSSVYIDNKGKNILILGEAPTQGLDGTTLTVEKSIQLILLLLEKYFCLINQPLTGFEPAFCKAHTLVSSCLDY